MGDSFDPDDYYEKVYNAWFALFIITMVCTGLIVIVNIAVVVHKIRK